MAREIGIEPVVIVNRAEYLDDALKDYCASEQLDIIGEIPDERRIAESYSRGELAIVKFPELRRVFEHIADRILILAGQERKVQKKKKREILVIEKAPESAQQYGVPQINRPKELVVISGKGGTGKTSLTACFIALAKSTVIADCDVDAADLHLILTPKIKERGLFSGGTEVNINQDKCTQCGDCKQACRFFAIKENKIGGVMRYSIDELACEGCGVCKLVCEYDSIKSKKAVNGEWFMSDTRYGPMSHANLGVAEENSGRLVTLVRDKANLLAGQNRSHEVIMDGAPGTGCPVISSLTGTSYALAVTEPTVSGVHDLERILQVIKHFGVESGVVVNKYDLNPELTQVIEKLAEKYNSNFLGTIPYGKEVTAAQMRKLSVVEYTDSPVTDSIIEIWKKISKIFSS
jgi:MinD superfamily P-loop ATPase